jgi:hypothetical protein
MIKKAVSFEFLLSKNEVESILRKHFEAILEKEDVDFKNAKWCQDDFTYDDKDRSISVCIILDEVKLRKK